ncbi:MAG: extracellular solute-binding protein, partial [Chloroflexi bacterium]|nr:extracellular solute-binding protein [Chloroflexota bacterium]
MIGSRIKALTWIGLLCVLVLSACQGASSMPPHPSSTPGLLTKTPKPGSTPTAMPVPVPTLGIASQSLRGVKVEVWHAFFGPAADLFAAQMAEFNAGNEWGITVNAAKQAHYGALFDEVSVALDGARRPDVAVALPEYALIWDASGAVTDLRPYVHDPQWGFTQAEVNDFPVAFWVQDMVGGKRLGVPAQRTARFLFYNRTWARELGFDEPPATAEEFRQQACAANQSKRQDADKGNDGKGGWIVDPDPLTALSWLLAFDGGVVASDGAGYEFDTPANQAALEYLKGLFDDHCAWLSTEPTPYEPFAVRSAVFVTGGLAELPLQAQAMSAAGNADEWTVIPFPGENGPALVAYGPSYVVLQSTPQQQLAGWLFIRWLLAANKQALWVYATDLFP